MPGFRHSGQAPRAGGRVDGPELGAPRRELHVGGKIDRKAADFLVELHMRVRHLTPGFEHFFYQAIKHPVLADGRIGPEEAARPRQRPFADGTIKGEERKFLHELKGQAEQVGPQSEAQSKEGMKQRPEQHTSGGALAAGRPVQRKPAPAAASAPICRRARIADSRT